jgi:hypothetical protein
VPEDIQHVENRRAWIKHLGSISRAQAEMLAHGLAHEHSKRILELRGLLKNTPLMRSPDREIARDPIGSKLSAEGKPGSEAPNLRNGRRPSCAS